MIRRALRRLKKRENRISLIFFIITMAVAIAPLMSRYCINGHDLEYHLLRIESIKEGILMGKPFLKVNVLFFGGAGYASSMFYSDWYLLIPALLRVMGFSIKTSYHLFAAMVFVACYLTTYISVFKMSYSKFAASIAAILMTLCPYHMDDILLRGAVGEYMAFIFVPLAVYGIYNVIFEDMDHPVIFGVGFAGLILTHPASCILCVFFALCAFIIYIRRLIKNPSILLRLVITTVITVLVTAFFWLPMLEQFSSAQFYVSENWSDLLDASLDLYKVFTDEFPSLGMILAVLVIPRFTLRRKDYPILNFVDFLLVMSLGFTFGTTNLVLWEKIGRFFNFLQFPWRLLIMSSSLLAIADAIILTIFLERLGEVKREIVFDAAIIVTVALCSMIAINRFNDNSMGYYDYSNDYYSFAPFTGNVIAGEWLPKTVTDVTRLVEQSALMTYDDASLCEFTRERNSVVGKVEQPHEYVDVPFVYYKGYKAQLENSNGETADLQVTGEGDNGLCRVYLNGSTGTLTVKYKSTKLQIVSYLISAVAALLLLAWWYFEESNKRKLKINAEKAGAVITAACVAIVLQAVAVSLTGCASVNITSSEPDSEYGSFSNPDEMVDYLKNRDSQKELEEKEKEEEKKKEHIYLNICKTGYKKDGCGFGVLIDESSGEKVVSVPDQKTVAGFDVNGYTEAPDIFTTLLKDEILQIDGSELDIEKKLLNETDMLLSLELFSENGQAPQIKKTALKFAQDIFKEADNKSFSTIDKYMMAAVLSKASYVLTDWEDGPAAIQAAEKLFDEAESVFEDDENLYSARLFAAAEIYRLTGRVTYKSVVDATFMDAQPDGFSYDNPGYYGIFTYLASKNQGSYKVLSAMMDTIFTKANGIIKEDLIGQISEIPLDDKLEESEEEQILKVAYNTKLVAMADYISGCVEYDDYMQKALCYFRGANLTGRDYTDDGEKLCDEPLFFVYDSLIE